ncbi:ribosomal subunit 39S-domain-containing protein [Bombardia bombarda]|uniref:Large ribosomal subunit protein mL50 n=1 Tax=Bombardia bombarda TaxID=252184 RepID=A0AA39WHS3_9PEZI|nr:ribosomal subunit 39S-domain-containing protein [Bombardia bombarda]
MRRLPRISSSASALAPSVSTSSSSSASLRTATCIAPASQTSQLSATRSQAWQSKLHAQRRCLSTTAPRRALETVSDTTDDSYLLDEDNDRTRKPEIKTDLVYPRGIKAVPRDADITDPDYKPAESGELLEEVGGLANWWDDPSHWGSSNRYLGFGPREKVTDPAMLEVLARRAVIEALAIKQFADLRAHKLATFTPAVAKEQELLITEIRLVPGEDGAAVLKRQSDYTRVWAGVKKAGVVISEESEKTVSESSQLDITEARELVKRWNPRWKQALLKDLAVKFYAAKRIQRLTGHVIPDAKLVGSISVGSLVAHLTKPPKAKKLTEELEVRGQLPALPNVTLYPRRVTPVDKQKMVGRWKLITAELEKRELPVIGTGGYGKSVETKWADGN